MSLLLDLIEILTYPVWSILIVFLTPLVPIRYFKSKTPSPPRVADATGKRAIVTGANSGLGLAVATELARRGAIVTLACRSAPKAAKAREEILGRLRASSRLTDVEKRVNTASLDVSSLASVRSFAEDWIFANSPDGKVDYLFLNAGFVEDQKAPDTFTSEGFELMYATNVLGHVLLTHELTPALSNTARIVSTASIGAFGAGLSSHFKTTSVKNEVEVGFHRPTLSAYIPLSRHELSYAQHKALNVVFTRALNARIAANGNSRRIATCYHPGFVKTGIFPTTSGPDAVAISKQWFIWLMSNSVNLFGLSADDGAETAIFQALAPANRLGRTAREQSYMSECGWRAKLPLDRLSDADVDRVWKRLSADAGISEKWDI